LADLQVKTYEDRVRERLKTKYPTHTPAEGRRLEEQIRNLFRFMQREEFSCRAIDRVASVEIVVRSESSKRERSKLLMNGNNRHHERHL
jgi:hypothetical protein